MAEPRRLVDLDDPPGASGLKHGVSAVDKDCGRGVSGWSHQLKPDGYADAVRETVSVSGFMVQARSMLSGGVSEDTLRAVGRLLGDVSRETGFVQEREMRALHGADSSFTVLQTDPDGLTLMLARFSPDEETPVHDHGSWGVACVVKGRDRYRHWALREDGRLRLLYEMELEAGSFVTWLDPPLDIHSQQGIGEDALELVLFGKNVTTIPRHYYDSTTGEARTALPR